MTSTSDLSSTSAEQLLAEVYRADWGRLLSLLVTRSRRLDLAEDSLGEAFARAAARWPSNGVPSDPAAWLYTTAWRQLLAGLRAEAMRGRKAPLLTVGAAWSEQPVTSELGELDDDRLALILLCCHPALHPHARSPLALRLILGTSTSEIARLFLVPKATMAARITRAKKKIVLAGIPLTRPADDELRVRLGDVCRTIYLAFTAGYTPGQGADLLRSDLAGDAVRLALILRRLVPGKDQVEALAALLLLQHARRDARVSAGRLVTLPEQDRTQWHRDEIAAGTTVVSALPRTTGYAEELRLQALIAAEHCNSPTAQDTDWRVITQLYGALEALTGSPVVRLNRAVALAESDGPESGLALLASLDDELSENHRLHAVRAELSRKAGDLMAAQHSYEQAIARCTNQVEHDHLQERLRSLA